MPGAVFVGVGVAFGVESCLTKPLDPDTDADADTTIPGSELSGPPRSKGRKSGAPLRIKKSFSLHSQFIPTLSGRLERSGREVRKKDEHLTSNV